MYKTMLQMIGEQTASVLQEKGSARALWLNEWAKLFLKAYEPGAKVVYTSVYTFPMELLAVFDVVPFDFEVAGAMISSTEMGVPTMRAAEERGYAMDVCSMHRAPLGASYLDYFPRPDLLLTTSHYCDQKAKTNELLARMYKKEAYLLYVPAEISRASIKYVEAQLREIAEKIASVAGHELDEDRLREAVRSSNRARQSRLKLMELQRHRPAPWTGGTLIGYSINSFLFDGTETMERLNDAYIKDLESRIASGKAAPEKHRLYWFAWLPVYDSDLFSLLKENRVTFPLCETMRVYWDEIDEDNPFEGLALKCLKNLFVGPISWRLDGIERIISDYRLDGALLFATPACRHSNAAYKVLKDRLAQMGVPFLLLDMDISDPRGYSAEQVKVRLESFVELLERRE
ncbi:MAG: 2-hydroxyacyl-CoA dehydratase [Candidatus Abyssobacteria bacterium SURF_5]|uniref:2-hydroxyacyl-CoA dehydratase n=1 Tax=Abyssobacteria bacterium (strain SURF_5) TaxID=2093360 RepID=A0A3A4P0J8_ABYX5|nr:MAG: 2-hydroxyacyl-CoA dehydratase [Candidatus Abyssubacteria bacterium SURF_5]